MTGLHPTAELRHCRVAHAVPGALLGWFASAPVEHPAPNRGSELPA